MPKYVSTESVDMGRLADWVREEKEKYGSWARFEDAIAAANPGDTPPISDQGLIDWRDKKNQTVKPEKIQALANYLGQSYEETYAWLHGKELVTKPDLLRRVESCQTIEELSQIGDMELFPALKLFMGRAVDLSVKPEPQAEEFSISAFIRSKIAEKGLSLEQGIAEITKLSPRRLPPKRVRDLILGKSEPDPDSEIHELAFALGSFLGVSITVEDLLDRSKRVLLIGQKLSELP